MHATTIIIDGNVSAKGSPWSSGGSVSRNVAKMITILLFMEIYINTRELLGYGMIYACGEQNENQKRSNGRVALIRRSNASHSLNVCAGTEYLETFENQVTGELIVQPSAITDDFPPEIIDDPLHNKLFDLKAITPNNANIINRSFKLKVLNYDNSYMINYGRVEVNRLICGFVCFNPFYNDMI